MSFIGVENGEKVYKTQTLASDSRGEPVYETHSVRLSEVERVASLASPVNDSMPDALSVHMASARTEIIFRPQNSDGHIVRRAPLLLATPIPKRFSDAPPSNAPHVNWAFLQAACKPQLMQRDALEMPAPPTPFASVSLKASNDDSRWGKKQVWNAVAASVCMIYGFGYAALSMTQERNGCSRTEPQRGACVALKQIEEKAYGTLYRLITKIPGLS